MHSDSDKYQVLPFAVTVLIDQDRVQDFLIELENSPMSIQVKDFELVRPAARVTKPEKGDSQSAGLGMMGMMGMMGGGRRGGMGGMGMGGMVGMGGMASQMANMMSQQGMRGGGMAGAGMPGAGGMGSAKSKGKDVRSKDRGDEREAKTKAINEAKGPTLFDMYFDIVEVKVYGQARFYNAPPRRSLVSRARASQQRGRRRLGRGAREGRQD